MKRNKNGIKQKWGGTIVRVICLVVVLVVILLTLWLGMGRIYRELESHIQYSMRDVTNQNIIALDTEMRAKASLLQGMAAGLPQDRAGIESQLHQVHEMKNMYKFRRMGYIEPDGDAYTSDGFETNLAHREYFHRAMQGHLAVSESLYDTVGDVGTYINVMAAPVSTADGNGVRGVLFAIYETSQFRELLAIESFDGLGTSGIVLHDGTVLVGSEKYSFLEGQNLFERLTSYGKQNDEAAATLQADFADHREGFTSYTTDEEKYIFYTQIHLLEDDLNWHMITLVPASVLNGRMEPIRSTVTVLGAVTMLVILLFLLVLAVSYWRQRKRLEELAYTDTLTGGDNYNAFRAKMRERKQAGYIISADLDNFKMINNTCSIRQGDALIRAMWQILFRSLHENEFAAHISGDNFVMFLRGKDLDEILCRVARCDDDIRNLSERLDIPHVVPKFGIYPTEDSSHPEDGYGKANLAKKQLVDRVDNCCVVYSEQLRLHALSEQWMEDNFEVALKHEQFEVWYQPKYDPVTGLPVGAEALVRWRREDGSLIPPGQFIPLFERNGMIARLDLHVFRKVCQSLRRWIDMGWSVQPVSVNVSRGSLYYRNIVDNYVSIVNEVGIDVSLIRLEITESVMVDNAWVEDLIRRFRKAGFGIQLDDFGSGYSSMALLSTDCFQTIKLDKSLIDCIGDERGEKLLTQISNLAHGLGLSITAEGVEKQTQVQFLTGISCDDIQGYYYSRPLPIAEYESLLRDKN